MHIVTLACGRARPLSSETFIYIYPREWFSLSLSPSRVLRNDPLESLLCIAANISLERARRWESLKEKSSGRSACFFTIRYPNDWSGLRCGHEPSTAREPDDDNPRPRSDCVHSFSGRGVSMRNLMTGAQSRARRLPVFPSLSRRR